MSICRKDKGFTLLETVISLAVFMVLLLSATNILVYATKTSSRFYIKQELLENARIGLDFITAHVKAGDELTLKVANETGTLDELAVKKIHDDKSSHVYNFKYWGQKSPGATKYHRLEFSENELASYISDIQIRIDGDIMTIKIITDGKLDAASEDVVEPIALIGKINVKYKTIN